MVERAYTINPDGSRARLLIKPIAGAEADITAVVLRKPRYREIMQFGDPSSLILMEGAVLPHEDMGTVEKYVNALAGDQNGNQILPGLLNQIDYLDALALKDAVISFFKTAEATSTSAEPPKS